MTPFYDIAVVGGGIVGMSFAMQAAAAFPGSRVIVLEKELKFALHQTRRNSRVIHGGMYYKAGSLKARLCVAGAREMVEFCSKHAIPYEICGKLIVATNGGDPARLSVPHEAGIMNELTGLRILEGAAMREIEPHVGGIRALHVPSTGITDYSLVTSRYAAIAENAGVEIKTGARVAGFRRTADEAREKGAEQ